MMKKFIGFTLSSLMIMAFISMPLITHAETNAEAIARIEAQINSIKLQLIPLLQVRVEELRGELINLLRARVETLRGTLVATLQIRVNELQAQLAALKAARGIQ